MAKMKATMAITCKKEKTAIVCFYISSLFFIINIIPQCKEMKQKRGEAQGDGDGEDGSEKQKRPVL